MKDLATHIKESVLDTTPDFDGLTSLMNGMKIVIPEDLTNLNAEGFKDAKILAFPEGIRIIGNDENTDDGPRFADVCPNVTKIIFPSTIESIGRYAFCGLKNLETVEFSKGSDVEIWHFAFADCPKLRDVVSPDSADIYYGVFSNCTSLRKITLSRGIKKFFGGTFAGCTNLVSVDARGIKFVDSMTFDGCTSLRDLKLDKEIVIGLTADTGMTTHLGYTFRNCKSLAKIGSVITNLPQFHDFEGCSKIKELDIIASSKHMNFYEEESTFDGCTSLKSINIVKVEDDTAKSMLQDYELPAGAKIVYK